MDARPTFSSALALLGALALLAGGCGSSKPPATDPPGTTTTAAAAPGPAGKPSAVSVLASDVRVLATQVTIALRLRQPPNVDPPLARSARLDLLGVGAWGGSALPTCSAATLRAKGADGCPAGSVLGHGEALGAADTSQTLGLITVVNGGGHQVFLATIVRNPAYVKTVIVGTVSKRGSGIRLDLTFPRQLQVIAGVPVGLQQLHLTLDRRVVPSARRCPSDGPWRYATTVAFVDDTSVTRSGTVDCPKG